MAEQRRRFSPQFKAETMQMVIETGRPSRRSHVCLGIHEGTLGNWVADRSPGAQRRGQFPAQRGTGG